jgi:hypothetical protein
MKLRTLTTLAALALSGSAAFAQGLAPAINIGDRIFTGTITAATGGANSNGPVFDVFTSTGTDYTLSNAGVISAPSAYTYVNTGANTGTITEPATATQNVTVALTFTSTTAGTFTATYAAGVTQTGTFTLTAIPFAAPLGNMSSLISISAGSSVVSGLVIQGGVQRSVLIRAVGPGLVPFGIATTLANPTLSLMNSASTVLATNAGWASAPALQTAFTQAGAFNLPANSKDAAIVATLSPGAYTILIKGLSATDSGPVLIEVYYLN